MSRAAVLVVDDDADLRDWIAAELTNRDFSVERASSGRMALEVQSRRRFDLALIDLRMPGMDGIETLTALKQRDPDLEAVVATGHATVPAAVESMKLGAFDFIQKPYTLRQLLPLLERALEKSRLQGTVALHEASATLLGTHKAGELVEQAAGVLKRMLRADAVGVTLSQQPTPSWFPGTQEPQADDSIVSMLATQVPFGEDAVRLPAPVGEAAPLGPYGSAIVVSLRARGTPIGALVMLRRRDEPGFTSEEYRRAILFGDQLALAIDNARLHEELAAKVQEVTKTRDALIFAEKLALTGQLTAGVAHEINTPLTYVRFNLDFVVATADRLVEEMRDGFGASEEPPLFTTARQALNELRTAAADARDGVERIVRIVKDLNMFAQPDRDQLARLDLGRVLDWAANVANPQIRPRARLVKNYGKVPAVQGNETRLGQVFVNLLVNAAQAIPSGHPDANQITIGLRQDGDRVVVDVQDTGGGIDPAHVERIFEPFFTTKPLGTGTGLGLPICRTIVTEHAGRLTVESSLGRGTTFHVSLPAAKGDAPPAIDRSKVLRN
jgi:signal transduction histidine kinase/FixJ family two-component response regulator